MSNDENKWDKIQPSAISKHKNVAIENVVAPEVKILNRGDLLGAINCLFPELQLNSCHIKLKKKFSLFSHSLQELTSIFESGRKYRSRTDRNTKFSIVNSARTEASRTSSKRNSASSDNMVIASKSWKTKAQKKRHHYETEPTKRCGTLSFQSTYTDFVAKFLESHFPDRFVDFKNIECVIGELNKLFKEMSTESKIGPFNPNLPVINISQCDKVVRMSSGAKDMPKTSASLKRICSKRKSRSRTQIEARGRRKKSIVKKRQGSRLAEQIQIKLPEDCDDENGRDIERSIEDLLSDDTFSPRYNAKHSSDIVFIFRKPPTRQDSTVSSSLEKEAIEQYENVDDVIDMNFDLTEIKSNSK